MKQSDFNLVANSGELISVSWTLEKETLSISISDEQYEIDSNGNLERSLQNFLSDYCIQKNIEYHLISCVTCIHFSMSGMAQEMGRGQVGNCDYHKNRVEICNLCQDYSKSNRWKQ